MEVFIDAKGKTNKVNVLLKTLATDANCRLCAAMVIVSLTYSSSWVAINCKKQHVGAAFICENRNYTEGVRLPVNNISFCPKFWLLLKGKCFFLRRNCSTVAKLENKLLRLMDMISNHWTKTKPWIATYTNDGDVTVYFPKFMKLITYISHLFQFKQSGFIPLLQLIKVWQLLSQSHDTLVLVDKKGMLTFGLIKPFLFTKDLFEHQNFRYFFGKVILPMDFDLRWVTTKPSPVANAMCQVAATPIRARCASSQFL